MSLTSERLLLLIQNKKVSYGELARRTGIPKSALQRYATGETGKMPISRVETIAKALGVDSAYLMGWQDEPSTPKPSPIPPGFQPLPEMSVVPIIGRIACGQPITAEENIEGTTSLPAEWKADFVLICEGQSMEPKINDGDAVAIRKVEEIHNGQIAAVRIDNEATLKKVYLYPDRLELRAINPNFEPIILWKEEMNRAAIEGKAVGLCRGI
jgi:repressor LexA